MRQKTMLKYLLGLGVLVAMVAMGMTLGLTARNTVSTSPEIAHAAVAISPAEIDSIKGEALLLNIPPSDPNSAWLTDSDLEDVGSMDEDAIRTFLRNWDTPLGWPYTDYDGTNIDPPAVIAQEAQNYTINPRVLLATMEKEQAAITRGAEGPIHPWCLLGYAPGNCPNNMRDQIRWAARQFRLDLDSQRAGGYTAGGWRVGVTKQTQDGVWVTPATMATAGQFSYTPNAGIQWGGSGGGGGVWLFYHAWYEVFQWPGGEADTAPAGFRLPFVGRYEITAGPGCTSDHTGALNGEAIDFGLPAGAEVRATEGGTAYRSFDDTSGNVVHLVHSNGLKSIYAHLSSFNVSNGQSITKGQVIGWVGSTGNTTGPHLHFAVLEDCTSNNDFANCRSIFIRDMPGITWYSGSPATPCNNGEYEHPAPGGGWYDGEAIGPPAIPDGVTLYEHANYGGRSETFTDNDPDLGNNTIGDNTASSIRIEGDHWAIVYEHPDYRGRYEIFTSSDTELNNNPIGNDAVSSIQVGRGAPPTSDPKQASDLSISPQNPELYQSVTFRLEVHNDGDAPITFQNIGPQGNSPTGGLWNEFAHNVTVYSGQTIEISTYRSFAEPGAWTIANVPYQDQSV